VTSHRDTSATFLEQEYRDETQKERDAVNAVETVWVLIDNAQGTVDLVTLADMLGLEDELKELVGELEISPERHRRFTDVVEQLAAERADAIAAVAAAAALVKRNTQTEAKRRERAALKKEE